MKNTREYELTEVEKAAGVEIVAGPLPEVIDTSERSVERIARGFIMGSQRIGRQREIRQDLETRVVKRIGRKGKYLVDKLFELIEGVYIVDKRNEGTLKFYQVPPSLNAIIYALDRVLGKPTARTEATEERKGIMVVEHIIRNLAGDKSFFQTKKEVAPLLSEQDLLEMQKGEGDKVVI